MNFNEYQEETGKTFKFGEGAPLAYLTMGLTGEAGEVAEYVKKFLWHTNKVQGLEALPYELGDVLWYLARLAAEAGYTLQEIAEMNIQKLAARHGGV